MPAYLTYGLRIQSDVEIPELVAAKDGFAAPDARIRLESVEPPAAGSVSDDGSAVRLPNGDFAYTKADCGRFLIRSGDEILVDPDPGAEDRVWRLSLFGPVLALLMLQRGHLVLHGAALATAYGAVLLLGPNGSGKSTLAGELCKRGHRLLSDDVIVLSREAGPPSVLPGVPLIKLWPDALASSPSGNWTRVLHPAYEKRARRLADDALGAPCPAARVFALDVDQRLALDPAGGGEVFRALMGSVYAARFGTEFVSDLDGHTLLMQVSGLAQSVSFDWLRRPQEVSLLPRMADLVAGEAWPTPRGSSR